PRAASRVGEDRVAVAASVRVVRLVRELAPRAAARLEASRLEPSLEHRARGHAPRGKRADAGILPRQSEDLVVSLVALLVRLAGRDQLALGRSPGDRPGPRRDR